MRYLFFVIIVLFVSCDGTLGGFNERVFSTPKKNIENALDTLFIKNPELEIPDKWGKFDTWDDRGFGFLDTRIFYLQTIPEEMYYVSFVENGKENQVEQGPTILSIRSVGTGNGSWREFDKFSEIEKARIESRFDKEVISKIEKYSGIKAIKVNR